MISPLVMGRVKGPIIVDRRSGSVLAACIGVRSVTVTEMRPGPQAVENRPSPVFVVVGLRHYFIMGNAPRLIKDPFLRVALESVCFT